MGQEVDLIAEYQAYSAMKLGFGFTHLFTGEFLNKTTSGRDYTYPFVYAEHHF